MPPQSATSYTRPAPSPGKEGSSERLAPFSYQMHKQTTVEKEETFTTVSAKTQPAQDAQAQTVERQRRQSEVSTLSRSLSNLQPPNDKRSPHTQEGGRNTAHRPDAKASAISFL